MVEEKRGEGRRNNGFLPSQSENGSRSIFKIRQSMYRPWFSPEISSHRARDPMGTRPSGEFCHPKYDSSIDFKDSTLQKWEGYLVRSNRNPEWLVRMVECEQRRMKRSLKKL
ncbi:unnamed protein product [Prunus brigantina]